LLNKNITEKYCCFSHALIKYPLFPRHRCCADFRWYRLAAHPDSHWSLPYTAASPTDRGHIYYSNTWSKLLLERYECGGNGRILPLRTRPLHHMNCLQRLPSSTRI